MLLIALPGLADILVVSSRPPPIVAAGSAPAFDAASSTSGTAVSSLSWPITNSSSANRVVFLTIGGGDGTQSELVVSSVTCAGIAGVNIWATNGPTWVRSEGWYVIAPPTGSNLCVVNFAGQADQAAAGAIAFTGVHQTTPVDTAATASGTSTAPSVTVTSATTDAVVSGVSSDSDTSLTVNQGTERWQSPFVGSDTRYAGSTAAGASSVVMSWTTAPSAAWAQGGVSINPP